MGLHFLTSCKTSFNPFLNRSSLQGHTDHGNENKDTFFLSVYNWLLGFAGICVCLVKINIFLYDITKVSIIQWTFTLQQRYNCINDAGIGYALEINGFLPSSACGGKCMEYSIFLFAVSLAFWIRFQFSKICKSVIGPLGPGELFTCSELKISLLTWFWCCLRVRQLTLLVLS